jgi:hypothetical protein
MKMKRKKSVSEGKRNGKLSGRKEEKLKERKKKPKLVLYVLVN